MNVLTKFHGKPSNLHPLLIRLREGFLSKNECEFSPSKDLNLKHIEPFQPRANEITEPLFCERFTACKLELHGKAIVLQSRFRRRPRFSRGQQRTKRKEKILPQNKNKPRSKCRSVVSRSTRFRKMKNPTMKNNPDLFLEVALS